jgi:Leucine-rich repeat (LRR) protein
MVFKRQNLTLNDVKAISSEVNSIEFDSCRVERGAWTTIIEALSKVNNLKTLSLINCEIKETEELTLSKLQNITSLTIEIC